MSKRRTFNLPDSLDAKLTQRASQEGEDLTQIAVSALEAYLDTDPNLLRMAAWLGVGMAGVPPHRVIQNLALAHLAWMNAKQNVWGSDLDLLEFPSDENGPLVGKAYYEFQFERYHQDERERRRLIEAERRKKKDVPSFEEVTREQKQETEPNK